MVYLVSYLELIEVTLNISTKRRSILTKDNLNWSLFNALLQKPIYSDSVRNLVFLYMHSVHWGINPPSQKQHTLFLAKTLLKSANCLGPSFFGNPPYVLVFREPSLPPKTRILKILWQSKAFLFINFFCH